MGETVIHFAIPWDSEKNIGRAYNRTMEMVGDDDWVCFVDGDAVLCHTFFGRNIERVIEDNSFDLYSCMTNRVGCKYQVSQRGHWMNNDLHWHRNHGTHLWEKKTTSCRDVSNEAQKVSGVLLLLSKSTWKRVGPFMEGMLGVDNDYHRKVVESGGKVGVMLGIYAYHWYRNGNMRETSHLK